MLSACVELCMDHCEWKSKYFDEGDAGRSSAIMVFDGNGMLGSATVERLL